MKLALSRFNREYLRDKIESLVYNQVTNPPTRPNKNTKTGGVNG